MCDPEAARFYGAVKQELKKKGKPIPENDIWIAALAKEHQMILVTQDQDFNFIENLARENWLCPDASLPEA